MNLVTWAIRHNVSAAALDDLKREIGLFGTGTTPDGRSESAVSNAVRLEAAQKGVMLWRNNVGALQDADGRVIRYGLANDSKAVNQKIKSSDLVGLRDTGQFVCREVKAANWQYKGTDHEQAQLRFISLVLANGGDAAFATGTGTL